MNGLKVWAPNAQEVIRAEQSRQTPMQPAADGWWYCGEPVAIGADYGFVINGEGPFPDPRSHWQPNGVDGLSRAFDHNGFTWTDNAWRAPPIASAIIYELHVGTFTPEGTFTAVIGKLDYLLDLGVTHIELMPVAEFSGAHGWGYDGVDLYAPHQAYGHPNDLKRLVNECHRRGLSVILDVVYNHLGPAGNYLARFGPYFTDRYHTPWGDAVNFDGAQSDEVRRFFVDNALMWLRDYHFDGLRIDAVHAILDTSAEHILEQIATEVERLEVALQRPLALIAESDLNDPRVIRPQVMGGYGIHAQWSDDFHHALHTALTGEIRGYYGDFGLLSDLSKALTNGFVYDGRHSEYRQRTHGRPATGIYSQQLVGYLQNHDQVGNRATGDRSSHLLDAGQLKIGAALVLSAPFLPMLFQGEEWAARSPFLYFTDHQDSDLGEAVKHGRQSEFSAFGWQPEDVPNPQDKQTFLASKLNWQEAGTDYHADLLAWHKALIALRKKHLDLQDSRLAAVAVQFDENAQWLVLQRGAFYIVCNFADASNSVPVATDAALELASDLDIRIKNNQVKLPAHSVAIIRGVRSEI